LASYNWNPSTLTATWTYNGAFLDSSTAYTATLAATTVKDTGGVQLDGNGDGIPGDNSTFNFKQLKPTISLSGTSPVMVNTAFTLTYGSVVDAGQTVTNYLIHWGDGTISNFTSAGTASHTYSASGPFTISADLTDANGTHVNCGSIALQVNRALVSLAGNNANANQNGTYTLNLGTVNDPGQTPTSYTVHWGDSTATTASSGPFTHTYTKTGSDTIIIDVTDGAGTVTTAGTFKVSVNASPSDYITGTLNTNQGGSYRLTVNPPTDTGYSVSGYLIHWGDGTTTSASASGTFTHVYSATGTDSISVDLTDPTGTFVGAGGKLTLKVNPPPTIALTGSATDNQGDIYTLNLGAVTDPGQSVSQYTVHWGDGTASAFTAGGPVSHIFQASGNLHITVDLTDGTGTFASAGTLNVAVSASQSLTITASDPVDNFYLKLDSNRSSFDLWQNSATPGSGTPDFLLNTGTNLAIQCSGGSDTLTVDETAGIINLPGGITFNASAGGNNSMSIIGTTSDEILAVNNANASFGASTINYTNIGSVLYTDGGGNDTINVNGAIPVTVNLGAGSDTVNLGTGSKATVNMGSTGDITINGNGNVTINISGGGGNISSSPAAILAPTTATNFGTPVANKTKLPPPHKHPARHKKTPPPKVMTISTKQKTVTPVVSSKT
jgi:hypothetical protein